MHSFGREIYTTKTDINGSVTLLSSKQFWNFGFQTQYDVNMTIAKTDKLSTHCIYDVSFYDE